MNEINQAILNAVKASGVVYVLMLGERVAIPCSKLMLSTHNIGRDERLHFLPVRPQNGMWVIPAGRLHLVDGNAVLSYGALCSSYKWDTEQCVTFDDMVKKWARLSHWTKTSAVVDL